jgi:hypothetical protein
MTSSVSLPTFACHYYLPDRGPFRSLSDLASGADNPIFQELLTRHTVDPKYRRRFGSDYLCRRKTIEAELRQLFLERGGKPVRETPFYMTLGESPWFKGLNEQHREVRIPLSELNPQTTSVTFPDSFITMSKPDKAYFRKVFTLPEIPDVVKEFGLPVTDRSVDYEGYWRTDFEFYIELQVWEEPKYISSINCRAAQQSEA